MPTTIVLGSCVSVQGEFVKKLPGGRVLIRVGEKLYSGRPVGETEAA